MLCTYLTSKFLCQALTVQIIKFCIGTTNVDFCKDYMTECVRTEYTMLDGHPLTEREKIKNSFLPCEDDVVRHREMF